MSSVVVTCPGCGAKLRVPAASTAVKFRCPQCKTVGTYAPSAAPATPDPAAGTVADDPFGGMFDELAAAPPPSPTPRTSGSRRKDRSASTPNRTWLYAGLAGGSVLVLALVSVVIWLVMRSGDEPAPATPAAAQAAGASQALDPPAEPPKEPALQPLASKALGWYAEYLPPDIEFVLVVKPAPLLTSAAFRKALAPVSLAWQMFLVQAQQQLGFPVDQLQEFVLAFGSGSSSLEGQDGKALIVGIMKSAVPFPEDKLKEGTEAVEYAGKTYYVQPVLPLVALTQQVNPAIQSAMPEKVATWALDANTVIVANEPWIRALIDGKRTEEAFPEDLRLAMAAVQNAPDAVLLVGVHFGPRMKAAIRAAREAAARVAARSGPSGAPGTAAPFPGQAQPGGSLGPGALGPAGPQAGPGGGSSAPEWRALTVVGHSGERLSLGLAILCENDIAASQLQMQLGSLKGIVPALIDQAMTQQQQQPGTTGPTAGGAPGPGTGSATPSTDPRIAAGLQSLRQSIDAMQVQLNGEMVVASVEFAPEAIAGLIILGMQQSAAQSQAQQAGGTPTPTGASPPGRPGTAPPLGFPAPSSPAPGFPGADAFPKDKPAQDGSESRSSSDASPASP